MSRTVNDNLTSWEWGALDSLCNLADGHSHQSQNSKQLDLVRNLPALFNVAETQMQTEIQREFESAFFGHAKQPKYAYLGPPLYHYSSSISIEVVANYLRLTKKSVALLHPTFDNIPSILRRHGIALQPIEEEWIHNPEKAFLQIGAHALFLVLPNNPTGLDIGQRTFESIVHICKERGLLLILDFSFRFFSSLTEWDQYEILIDSGIDFITIEDTGKTWPTLDLKIGITLASPSIYNQLQRITDDFLLNVSPFIFTLIANYISLENASTVEGSPRETVQKNRAILRSIMATTPIKAANRTSEISVEWLKLPQGWNSVDFCKWLYTKNISILPGAPFYWADQVKGHRFVRVALLRPEEMFLRGVSALRDEIIEYSHRL